MTVCFTIISNLVVSTSIYVNNVRADLLLRGFLQRNNNFSLHGAWKITLCLQNFKLFPIDLTKQVLG